MVTGVDIEACSHIFCLDFESKRYASYRMGSSAARQCLLQYYPEIQIIAKELYVVDK